jgi:uncharacterized peroxidase-related enzyme
MPYITLNTDLPGIRGLLAYRKQTAKPLLELADALLQAPSDLSKGDRELIAAYVSYLNDCNFCQNSHSAAAACHYGDNFEIVLAVKNDPDTALIPGKLKALLVIAACVQKGGKNVSEKDIETAKKLGATDIEIHDTVLIAAAFCMFNRYVDGLNTWSSDKQHDYAEIGKRMAQQGYMREESRKLYGI